MKKQLIIFAIAICVALPLFALVQGRKHMGGKRKDLAGDLRNEYRTTFKLINQNAGKLKASEKEALIKKLTAHFNGAMGTEEVLRPQEAQEIYESAIKTFTELKKLEANRAAKRKNLIGTEGKRHHYSPSIHFAQKVLGSIIYPNAFLTIQKPSTALEKMKMGPANPIITPKGPRTSPVGPEKGRVKMGPANPIRTSGAKTILPR